MYSNLVVLVPKPGSLGNICIILLRALCYAASSCEQDVSVSRHFKSLLTLELLLLHLCSSPKYFNYLCPFTRAANVHQVPLENLNNYKAPSFQSAVDQ